MTLRIMRGLEEIENAYGIQNELDKTFSPHTVQDKIFLLLLMYNNTIKTIRDRMENVIPP